MHYFLSLQRLRHWLRAADRGQRGAAAILALLIMTILTMTSLDSGRTAAFDVRIAGALGEGRKAFDGAELGLENLRWHHAKWTDMEYPCEPAEDTITETDPGGTENCPRYRTTANFGPCDKEPGAPVCPGLNISDQLFRTLNWSVVVDGYTQCDPTKGALRRLRGNLHAVVLAVE
jgi:Tfp pilus assembly protein PilX